MLLGKNIEQEVYSLIFLEFCLYFRGEYLYMCVYMFTLNIVVVLQF